MTINHLLPPPSKDFNDAKRMYMEQFGSALVTNTYLKIALLCVSMIAGGLLLLNFRTQAKYTNVKPLVIRIDEVGRQCVEGFAVNAAVAEFLGNTLLRLRAERIVDQQLRFLLVLGVLEDAIGLDLQHVLVPLDRQR